MPHSNASELVLRPNPVGVLGCALFFVACAVAIFYGAARTADRVIGLLALMLGITALALAFALALSKRTVLRISPEGFRYGTFREVFQYNWSQVERFSVHRSSAGRRVHFSFTSAAHQEGLRRGEYLGEGRSLLPCRYGRMSLRELAELLDTWRTQFALREGG